MRKVFYLKSQVRENTELKFVVIYEGINKLSTMVIITPLLSVSSDPNMFVSRPFVVQASCFSSPETLHQQPSYSQISNINPIPKALFSHGFPENPEGRIML